MTVASKLSACPSCGATLTSDARFCGGCGAAISATEPTAGGAGPERVDRAGREIAGRYRLLSLLGEGGMGAVYRAEQISLKREVALKLLKAELSADPALVRRFNAEAEMAAKLNHPNTVTLYDFGQDSDGSLFIAMEFIEGRSLRQVMVRDGPLPVSRTVAIAAQVCASLADAHDSGIVHRDLKPDNVMLSDRGKQTDVVRVLDFGIAKLRDTQGDMTAMPMTRAGDLLGTPQYMAPEQIRGERVDARTDVYALGAMLYEMITGRLAFEAPTLMAILSKHLTETPIPPVERRADLQLPLPLSELIMACMAKAPEHRPRSMDEVNDRLRELGEARPEPGAPVQAGHRPPTASGTPSVISAPPGVPRRLVTPSPIPQTTRPPAQPAPAAPAPPSPQPVAPPHAPPVAAGHLHPPPMTGAPVARRARNTGWMWAVLAAVLIGGAGLAAYLAMGAGSDGETAASGEPAGPASAPSTGGDDDVPSLADFDLDPGPQASGDPAPPQPATEHSHQAAGFFGQPHPDAVWNHPLLPFHIHYPQGFQVQNQGVAWLISGQWNGEPLEIIVFAGDLGVAQPPTAQRAMVLNLITQAGALVTQEGQRTVAGASRYSGTYEVRGEEKGEFVVYTDGPLLVLVGVGGPPSRFAHHAGFRRAFFENAVAVGR